MHQRNLTNGMTILGMRDGTIFVRLPPELQTEIDAGPDLPESDPRKSGWANACCCPYCKSNPDKRPMWDTLAIPTDALGHTWTVHMPDGRDARPSSRASIRPAIG